MAASLPPHNGCQCPDALATDGQRWTTPAAIARYLGYTHNRVCKLLRDGVIRGGQVQLAHYADERPRATSRGRWRVYEADLMAFLRKLRGKPVRTPNLRWKRKP